MTAPFSLPVSVTPQQVLAPGTQARPSAVLFNNGPNPVFVGGSGVTSVAGLELAPNGRVSLPLALENVFAVSGFSPAAAAGTATAAITQGGSVITVASGGSAYTTGSYLAIEQGSVRQEVAVVAAQTGTTVTISGTFAFAHGSASTFSAVTPATSVLSVSGGAT